MSIEPGPQVAVVGLGVVGIPLAALVAESGCQVIGLDVNEERVGALNRGEYPFQTDEPGIRPLIKQQVAEGQLSATSNPEVAVGGADVILVAVQTPVGEDGVPRFEHLRTALQSIGPFISPGSLLVIESTLAPGTMDRIVTPEIESASGLKVGKELAVGHCPERVMPGRLLRNLREVPRVVGAFDTGTQERMLSFYGRFVNAPLEMTDLVTAELVKTAENAYRDVQIAFANELALICQDVGGDVWTVRRLINLLPDRDVHMPGTGVGGHCIPKEGILLASAATSFDPIILPAARAVNESMPSETVRLLEAALNAEGLRLEGSKVVLLGLSYLPGSDDLRHSPSQAILNQLVARRVEVRVIDPYVRNEDVEVKLHVDMAQAFLGADAVILSTAHPEFKEPDMDAWKNWMNHAIVIDGRGLWNPFAWTEAGFRYRGIGRGRLTKN